LEFKLSEIEEYYHDNLTLLTNRLEKVKQVIADKETEDKKPSKSEFKNLETAQAAFDKLIAEKEGKIQAAREKAEKERQSINDVEQELITMLQDPEIRKTYFSVVDMEEIEENEFNLNLPRYVDTFEPEEEIDLKTAITEFSDFIKKENKIDNAIVELLKVISHE